MLRHLFRPFAYLQIHHESKWKVDWGLPLLLALLTVCGVAALRINGPVVVFSDTGLIAKCLSFVQSLPGFYIAALAAIATFNRPDIDKVMPGSPPNMKVRVRGVSVAIDLTRRRFLCVLFAFLTAESLILIILGIIGSSTSEAIKSLIPSAVQSVVAALYAFIFAVLFWQMIVASFWGLYYLGERLHQPDA